MQKNAPEITEQNALIPSPRSCAQLARLLRQHGSLQAEGMKSFYRGRFLQGGSFLQDESAPAQSVQLRKIREYTSTYQTLHMLRIGLDTTLEQLKKLSESRAISALIGGSINRAGFSADLPYTPLHACFTRDPLAKYAVLRFAFALCGCTLRTVRKTGLRQKKLSLAMLFDRAFERPLDRTDARGGVGLQSGSRPQSESALEQFVFSPAEDQSEMPISLSVPLNAPWAGAAISRSHYVLTSFSPSGADNIAMGLVTVNEQQTVETLTFAYASGRKFYVLQPADARFFLGREYPISENILELFRKRMLAQFDAIAETMGKTHVAYISEALISLLLNPVT